MLIHFHFKGLPFDSTKTVSSEIFRQFVEMYLEERQKIGGKDPNDITEEEIDKTTRWTYLLYIVSQKSAKVFMYGTEDVIKFSEGWPIDVYVCCYRSFTSRI